MPAPEQARSALVCERSASERPRFKTGKGNWPSRYNDVRAARRTQLNAVLRECRKIRKERLWKKCEEVNVFVSCSNPTVRVSWQVLKGMGVRMVPKKNLLEFFAGARMVRV